MQQHEVLSIILANCLNWSYTLYEKATDKGSSRPVFASSRSFFSVAGSTLLLNEFPVKSRPEVHSKERSFILPVLQDSGPVFAGNSFSSREEPAVEKTLLHGRDTSLEGIYSLLYPI